jgi:dTDP-4-amino-4,6-dideoxygalactose transaminase
LLDLRAQYALIRAEVRRAMDRVCDSQEFVLGGEVERFETELAEFVGARFAIGSSSGSDALLCALLALALEPGSEVITTPFTFVATAEAIARAGARPRFVDIEPDTMNIDPRRIASAIDERTRAIIPVHLFGWPAKLDAIGELCRARSIAVVEDAAQALGGSYRARSLGTWGTLGCFSFFPSKPLGAFGDGGMIVTDDERLAQRCRELRSHGTRDKTEFVRLGGNYRLDALQAAILRVKLAHLRSWLEARRSHAEVYDAVFGHVAGLVVPRVEPGASPAFANYTLRVLDGRRDALAAFLRARGIQTAVYYARPLHLQPCFAALGLGRGAFPESERAAEEVLSIPLYPELTAEQRNFLIESIEAFFV